MSDDKATVLKMEILGHNVPMHTVRVLDYRNETDVTLLHMKSEEVF